MTSIFTSGSSPGPLDLSKLFAVRQDHIHVLVKGLKVFPHRHPKKDVVEGGSSAEKKTRSRTVWDAKLAVEISMLNADIPLGSIRILVLNEQKHIKWLNSNFKPSIVFASHLLIYIYISLSFAGSTPSNSEVNDAGPHKPQNVLVG